MRTINIIGIIGTTLAIGFIVYANMSTSGMHKKKVEDTYKPNSQDEWNEIDLNNDSIDIDTIPWIEYHGKEGKSEYGPYESNVWE